MLWGSLHTHTTLGSMGDGYGSVDRHFGRAAELGIPFIGMTEHGSTTSQVQAEIASKKHGVKVIHGCELYVAEPRSVRKFHQTVLAMNEEGLRNLNRLVTRSYSEGMFGQWNTVHTEWMLDPAQTQGLLVLSGCADSWLSCVLLGGKSLGDKRSEFTQSQLDDAMRLIERYQECYGDRYYLELQRFPELDRSTLLNQTFADLSVKLGVETVATADVHYPLPEDNKMQRVLHAATRSTGTVEAADASWEYDILLTYPTSDQEIYDALGRQDLTGDEAEAAVMNAANIAARCEVYDLPKSNPVRYIPNNPADTIPAEDRLRLWIEKGLDHRYETNERFAADYDARTDVYLDRIEREIGVLIEKGFSDYFLVTADLCRYAKDVAKMGMGPGRGSAAGSLICYAIRITEINPMMKLSADFQFERFIDPSRPDMPDIDLDFARPAEIFEYAKKKYGESRVSHIGNFIRWRGKTAINDIASVYQIDRYAVKPFTNLIVDRPDGDARENDSVEDTIEAFEVARDLVSTFPELELAIPLEGEYKTLGVHAAGLVISADPIADTCAVYEKKSGKNGDKVQVIAYDKRDAEYLNILKLDALGLTTMRTIEDVVGMVDDLTLEDIYALPTDDPKVLGGFAKADLTGIFQFEGRTTRNIVEKVFEGWREGDPVEFATLADINALSRPGSLISGMTKRYEAIVQGRRKPSTYHPVIDKILADTHGCLIYQEQVMSIGREFGGFDGSKVGALRRIIGKKKAGGAFEAFYAEFAEGAQRLHGATDAEAREIWDFMATSSSYLFNIAHAAAYAVIAYWLMWLKIHYPAQFFACALRYAKAPQPGKPDVRLALMQDAVSKGLDVLPPSLKHSGLTWDVANHGSAIAAGFQQITGVGDKVAPLVIEWREKQTGEYRWEDLRYVAAKEYKNRPDRPASGVPSFGAKTIEKIRAFVESDDPFKIYAAANSCNVLKNLIRQGEVPLSQPDANGRAISMLKDEQVVYVGLIRHVQIIDVIDAERKRTNQSPDKIRASLDAPHLTTKAKVIAVDATGLEVHINIHRWMYPSVAEELSQITKDVDLIHVEGIARESFGPTVQAQAIVIIDPNG